MSEPRISVWFSHGPAQQLLKPQYARCSAKAWLYPDFHDADGISVVLDPGERKEIPQAATEQLSWFRKMYQDIWGIRASLEEQFAD